MESVKQTAVEWLIEQLTPSISLQQKHIDELKEQAKEMEKKRMIDFADNYVDNCVIPNQNMAIPTIMDVPNYYEQTYGGGNK